MTDKIDDEQIRKVLKNEDLESIMSSNLDAIHTVMHTLFNFCSGLVMIVNDPSTGKTGVETNVCAVAAAKLITKAAEELLKKGCTCKGCTCPAGKEHNKEGSTESNLMDKHTTAH